MTRPNVRPLIAGACAGLLLAAAAQAQVYRNVGPDGSVTFSDAPPAANARASSDDAAASAGGGALPYQLNQTAQRYPVTLYTANSCAACNTARNQLINRGIPFSEKTVESNDDIAALQKLSGSNELPVITIGQQRLKGYSDQEWAQYLDAAGYPKTSQLPSSYRQPAASPLVAAQAAAPAPQPANAASAAPQQEPEPSMAPVPTQDNPAGMRF
jgi:glutaredoxin